LFLGTVVKYCARKLAVEKMRAEHMIVVYWKQLIAVVMSTNVTVLLVVCAHMLLQRY
jgi:hypothetical protein